MPPDGPQAFIPQTPARSLVYRALLASAHGLYKAGNGCLFVAAGLLRREELQSASVNQHRAFNLTAFEVDAGLSPAEQYFYGKFLRETDRVLLAGCGSGRDLIALRTMGYDVAGLEPVPELVEVAREHLDRRGVSASVDIGLIQTAELKGPYDAVILSGGCYSYVQGSEVRVSALRRIGRHLSERGRVIVTYHPGKPQSRLGRWLTRASARVGKADWMPEPGDTFSHGRLVPGMVRYHHAFPPDELAREFHAAGFTIATDELLEEGLRFAAASPGRA